MPFKSKAQMRWMFANDPEMADRWAEHTPDMSDLPERADEAFERALLEVNQDFFDEDEDELGDEENLSDEERELMGLPPIGDDDRTDDEVSGAPPSMEFEPLDDGSPPSDFELPPLEDVEPAGGYDAFKRELEKTKRTGKRRGSYKNTFKQAATGDRDRFNSDYPDLRDDIDEYSFEIDVLHDAGLTFGAIARKLNDDHDLRTRPGPRRRKSSPGARRLAKFKCPKCKGPIDRQADAWVCENEGCGWEMTRAFTPEQIADYLRSTGSITKGPASSKEDMGSRIPHNHDDPYEWRENCPACTWSTSFDSQPQDENEDIKDSLRSLAATSDDGTFSTEEAIGRVMGSDGMKADIETPIWSECPNCGSRKRKRQPVDPNNPGDKAEWPYYCGNPSCHGDQKDRFGRPLRWRFGDDEMPESVIKTRAFTNTKVPDRFKNIGHYIEYILKNSPDFEAQGDLSKDYWGANDSRQIRWKYVGGSKDLKENTGMNKTCASCEEGHHERCRDESCDCCGGGSGNLREMFGEDMNRPQGSKPFMDWGKLGQFGNDLKKQADSMKGNTYQTQDGQLLFYKSQMQAGEQPLMANMTTGLWDNQAQPGSTQVPQQDQQSSPNMGSVFSSKLK